jgi:hypothetical protein
VRKRSGGENELVPIEGAVEELRSRLGS